MGQALRAARESNSSPWDEETTQCRIIVEAVALTAGHTERVGNGTNRCARAPAGDRRPGVNSGQVVLDGADRNRRGITAADFVHRGSAAPDAG